MSEGQDLEGSFLVLHVSMCFWMMNFLTSLAMCSSVSCAMRMLYILGRRPTTALMGDIHPSSFPVGHAVEGGDGSLENCWCRRDWASDPCQHVCPQSQPPLQVSLSVLVELRSSIRPMLVCMSLVSISTTMLRLNIRMSACISQVSTSTTIKSVQVELSHPHSLYSDCSTNHTS